MTQNMDLFFTREKGEQGKRMPVFLPDGNPTDHYINIRSVDSDIFRKAEAEGKRKAVELVAMESDDEKADAMMRSTLEVISSLIIDWSFEEECNLENKVRLLREAPQIRDAINRLAANRSYFYQVKPESSADGQSENSD